MNDKSSTESNIPVLKAKRNELSDGFLEEWLGVLATENAANMEAEVSPSNKLDAKEEGRFKKGVPVKLIFGMCAHLNQSNQVKYQAIELYDRFMQSHISQLMDDLEREYCGREVNWKQNRRWLEINRRVTTQSLLRVLTCIQIAGKFHVIVSTLLKNKNYLPKAPRTAIKVAVMERLLTKANSSYGVKAIQNSELRVLETVSFNPAVRTPLVYLEALLVIIGRNDDAINVDALYRICIQVLDLFYLRRSEVYTALFKKFRKQPALELPISVEQLNTPVVIRDERIRKPKRKRSQPMPSTDDRMIHVETPSNVVEMSRPSDRGRVGCRYSAAITKNLMLLSAALISCAAYHIDQVGYLKVVERLHFITRVAYHEIIEFTIVLVDELSLKSPHSSDI